ncbi:MAG TPA: hypothetical protein PLP17_13015, partial [Oligoflexia bacterium]|nr:hypothetical protein [Oligoflexia bacterium]
MLNLSLRKVLIGGHLALALVTSAIIVLIGVRSINDSVLKNAQQVANRSLDIASSLYEQRFSADALQLEHFTSALAPELPTAQVLAQQLLDLKNKLGFAVLNLCSSEGKPLAGTYQDLSLLVPVREDPVLQSALRGKPTWGTVLLSSVRLRFEGGAALANSAALRLPPGQNTGTIEEALLQWFAVPVFDAGGRIFALLYGGRLINGNSELVDAIRATL